MLVLISISAIFERKAQSPVNLRIVSHGKAGVRSARTGNTIMPPISSLKWDFTLSVPSSTFISRRNALMACVKWKLSIRSESFWPIPWITRTRSVTTGRSE